MKAITPTDAIGWTSAAVLLATIGRQVYSQWKSKATAGVSPTVLFNIGRPHRCPSICRSSSYADGVLDPADNYNRPQ